MSAFDRLSRSCGPVPPPELLATIDAFRTEVEREERAKVQAEDSAAVANLMTAVHGVVTPAQFEALRQAVNVIGSDGTSELDRLRAELERSERAKKRLIAGGSEWCRRAQEAESHLRVANEQLAEVTSSCRATETERDELKQRLHDAAMAKVWTNEDGKKFVFADDLKGPLLGITQGSAS